MILLKAVTKENIDDLLNLDVREDQRSFVSSVAESLAQAYVYQDNAFPFAVYDDEEIVGFIMMGPGNHIAKSLYFSMGFAETGLFENNMEELRLIL